MDDLPGLRRVLVERVEAAGRAAIDARGYFTLAVPGGSVASAFFPALAAGIDWSNTHLFWADERAVSPDDPASNYHDGKRLLVDAAGIPEGRVHRLRGEAIDMERAAAEASEELEAVAGTPPVIDVVLLGVGEDGHVASVFPGDAGASSPTAPAVVAVFGAPKPPPHRLSMSMPTLLRTRQVIVAALGEAKRTAVRSALRSSSANPLGALLAGAGSSLLLLDRDAGERL